MPARPKRIAAIAVKLITSICTASAELCWRDFKLLSRKFNMQQYLDCVLPEEIRGPTSCGRAWLVHSSVAMMARMPEKFRRHSTALIARNTPTTPHLVSARSLAHHNCRQIVHGLWQEAHLDRWADRCHPTPQSSGPRRPQPPGSPACCSCPAGRQKAPARSPEQKCEQTSPTCHVRVFEANDMSRFLRFWGSKMSYEGKT